MNSQYYCKKTEILTSKGFKLISQLQPNETVAVIDQNRFLKYTSIKEVVSEDYTGNMIQFINNGIDLLVIPGHKLYVGDLEHSQIQCIEASTDKSIHEYKIQKTIGWNATSLYKNDDFVSFLGYLHASGRFVNKYIVIDNIYRDTNLYDLLFRLPFVWKNINRDSVIIDDVILREYLLRFHYHNKNFVIPEKLKMTSSRQISVFLTSFFGKNWGFYNTTNYKYISDIQELIAKIGGNSEIYKRHDGSWILLNNNTGMYLNYPKPILQMKYSGTLYRLTGLPDENSLVYIRRNGRLFISYAN